MRKGSFGELIRQAIGVPDTLLAKADRLRENTGSAANTAEIALPKMKVNDFEVRHISENVLEGTLHNFERRVRADPQAGQTGFSSVKYLR